MARFRERIETRRMPYRLGICCFSPFSWRYSRCGTATTLCTGPFHRFPASSITAAPNCWSCRHRSCWDWLPPTSSISQFSRRSSRESSVTGMELVNDSAQANCLRIQNPKWTVQISVVGAPRKVSGQRCSSRKNAAEFLALGPSWASPPQLKRQ